jgi:hypothetical protein
MTKESLRNIGISSEGHILEIFHDIQALKLENTRLLNFPPLKVIFEFFLNGIFFH